MIVWIDAQLSPSLAPWIAEAFGVQAFSALPSPRARERRGHFRCGTHLSTFEAALRMIEAGEALVETT